MSVIDRNINRLYKYKNVHNSVNNLLITFLLVETTNIMLIYSNRIGLGAIVFPPNGDDEIVPTSGISPYVA